MKNNTNYFSHDCNAREDEKMLQLRAKYGREGYGIWWLIVEKLSEATDYKLLLTNKVVISTLYLANKDVITYLFTLGLLIEEGDYFYSPSLMKRMSLKTSAIEKMREGGKKAMLNRRGKYKVSKKKLSDCGLEAQENKVLITSKLKESKVKEYIVEKSQINSLLEKDTEKYPAQLYVIWKMIELGYKLENDKKKLLEDIEWVNGMVKDYLPRKEDGYVNWNTARTYTNQRFDYRHLNKKPVKNHKASIRNAFSMFTKPKGK